ncbi:MAG: hypothetical protein GX764_05005 [Firmicutes bacterium]|nr:hypothetical protein [Bacillota bacterium]
MAMSDRYLIGTAAGIIAAALKIALNWIFFFFDMTLVTEAHLGAMLVSPDNVEIPAALFMGAVIHLLLGTVFDVLLMFFLHASGKDYYWLKGGIYGALLWLVFFLLIPSLLFSEQTFRNVITAAVHLITNVVFGFAASFLIVKHSERVENPTA